MKEAKDIPYKVVRSKESREEILSELCTEIIDSQETIHRLEKMIQIVDLYHISKSPRIYSADIGWHRLHITPQIVDSLIKESVYKSIGREVIETWHEIYGGRHEWESEETARKREHYAIRKDYEGGKSIICPDIKLQAETLMMRIEKLLKDIQDEEQVQPCRLEVRLYHLDKHPEIYTILYGLKDVWHKQEQYLMGLYKQSA